MAMVTARSPFQGATDQETLAKTLRGELDLPTGLSLEAVLLIKSMVAPDPAKRITLAEALDHPWLTGEQLDSVSTYRPWAPLEEDDSDFDSDEDDDDQDEGDDEVDRNDDGVDDDSVDDALYELVRTKPAKCA
jgi:serine/threonine protein kinase